MNDIFVFGSNLAGIHGAGSAHHARKFWGAIYGVGVGRQGDSYAIPTKDKFIMTLPLADIKRYVADFLTYAKNNPELQFNVVEIGCGLAGFTPDQIAPFFKGYSSNVHLPLTFMKVLAR